MYLLLAIFSAAIFAVLNPISTALFDTSLWVAKILLPADFEENPSSKQALIIGQAALMEGWLSNLPFVSTLLLIASLIFGFLNSWWAGIVIPFSAIVLGTILKLVFTRPVGYYLHMLYHKMVNRAADYRAKNDYERSEAAQSYCDDLVNLIALYESSNVRPPNPNQLKNNPYGDIYYWLENGSTFYK